MLLFTIIDIVYMSNLDVHWFIFCEFIKKIKIIWTYFSYMQWLFYQKTFTLFWWHNKTTFFTVVVLTFLLPWMVTIIFDFIFRSRTFLGVFQISMYKIQISNKF